MEKHDEKPIKEWVNRNRQDLILTSMGEQWIGPAIDGNSA